MIRHELVLDVISKVLKQDVNSLYKELDNDELWDSFTLVEIIFALEDELHISFENDEIGKFKSINSILNITDHL